MTDVASRMADDKRRDFRIEAAIAKLYCSERAWEAVDTMVQIRGGRGYETARSLAARGEKPVPAEQMLRDMRINRIFEGSTEIMHLMIAREAVDQHLSVAGDILLGDGGLAEKTRLAIGATKFYAKWFPSLATGEGHKPSAFAEFGPLAKHLRYAERGSRKLARSTFYAMGRHQAKLEHKGALLGRIVDIGAELFAIAAACTYASTLASDDPAHKDAVYELADLFCKQARRRAEQLFEQLFDNDDASQYSLAQSVLDGRYEFFEHDVVDPAGSGPMIPDPAPALHVA
jgi:Acyl-CoA dehydrogenase, C-terminal domain